MHRFFVSREAISDNRVILRGDIVHQIRDVLRMHPGDEVTLLDNTGSAYRVELAQIERDLVQGRVTETSQLQSEPRARIALYQGLLKGQKFEWVLQKGTELGIAEFIPVLSSRSVVGRAEDVSRSRVERWRRIIVEAAEQSGRAALPSISDAISFAQACQVASRRGLSLIPWEGERSYRLRQALDASQANQVNLFIGPEGGFAEEEIAEARKAGAIPVTLGPRTLRAETAGLVAAAAILYELGDFG